MLCACACEHRGESKIMGFHCGTGGRRWSEYTESAEQSEMVE